MDLISTIRSIFSNKLNLYLLLIYIYIAINFAIKVEWAKSIYYWMLVLIAVRGVSVFKPFIQKERIGFYIAVFDHDDDLWSRFVRWLILIVFTAYLILLPIILANFNKILES